MPFAVMLAASLASQAPQHVRVGSWNLEFFGNRRNEPRSDADIAEVGHYIGELGVDVLAVQEVGTPQALQKLVGSLGPRWQFVLGSTGMWRDGSGGQRLGFLWNDARVELLQAEELLDLPREAEDPQTGRLPIFHRVPLCAAFRARNGGLDFRAVTVHLKADNRSDLDKHQRDEMSTRKRAAEMRALGRALTAMLAKPGEDQDLVLLGDFNHVFARERSSETPDETKVRYDLRVSLLSDLPGFVRLPPATPRPTIRYFPESIDHVVVSAGLREEALPATVAVHGPFETSRQPTEAELDAWQKAYSDHFPLTLDLDAAEDRDPDATFAAVDRGHELRPGGYAAAAAPVRPATPALESPAPTAQARTIAARSDRGPAGLLGPGRRVELRMIAGGAFVGTLLERPQGEWVHLQLDNGAAVAVPTRNVAAVVEK
ncbi:MAG: endonuclease/exonuclease/phosphatase family protein [Planctomycetota bacterium]